MGNRSLLTDILTIVENMETRREPARTYDYLTSEERTILQAAAEIMAKHGKNNAEIISLLSSRHSEDRRNRRAYDTKMDLESMLRNNSRFTAIGDHFRIRENGYSWYVKVGSNNVRIENSEMWLNSSYLHCGCYYTFDGESILSVKEATRSMFSAELASFKSVQSIIYQMLKAI